MRSKYWTCAPDACARPSGCRTVWESWTTSRGRRTGVGSWCKPRASGLPRSTAGPRGGCRGAGGNRAGRRRVTRSSSSTARGGRRTSSGWVWTRGAESLRAARSAFSACPRRIGSLVGPHRTMIHTQVALSSQALAISYGSGVPARIEGNACPHRGDGLGEHAIDHRQWGRGSPEPWPGQRELNRGRAVPQRGIANGGRQPSRGAGTELVAGRQEAGLRPARLHRQSTKLQDIQTEQANDSGPCLRSGPGSRGPRPVPAPPALVRDRVVVGGRQVAELSGRRSSAHRRHRSGAAGRVGAGDSGLARRAVRRRGRLARRWRAGGEHVAPMERLGRALGGHP